MEDPCAISPDIAQLGGKRKARSLDAPGPIANPMGGCV
jgi:hypothetical protein